MMREDREGEDSHRWERKLKKGNYVCMYDGVEDRGSSRFRGNVGSDRSNPTRA